MSPGAYVIICPRTRSFLENRVQKVIFFFPSSVWKSIPVSQIPSLRLGNLSQEIKAIAGNLSQEINGLCNGLPCLGQQGVRATHLLPTVPIWLSALCGQQGRLQHGQPELLVLLFCSLCLSSTLCLSRLVTIPRLCLYYYCLLLVQRGHLSLYWRERQGILQGTGYSASSCTSPL